MGAHSCNKHVGESFRNVRFIAVIVLKGLRMKLALSISRNFDVVEPTSGCDQVAAGIGAIAVPCAFGTALSPGDSNKLVQLLPKV